MTRHEAGRLRIFSTCPQSRDADLVDYRQMVAEAARWTEAAGFEGMLVYTDNGILDPWLVAQLLVQATERLAPLIAVQPIYMHPYTIAKLVSSVAYLHERRTHLNLLAGGFRNDLLALGDETTHDQRYDRTVEYGQIIKALVEDGGPVTFEGRYYNVRNLRLTPPVPPEHATHFTISGSSPAGLAAARSLGAIPVKYPRPSHEEDSQHEDENAGMRIGIIVRPDAEEAWRVAYASFPEDRKGQITHAVAMRVSDSQWHRELSAMAHDAATTNTPYWLGPFTNYKTFCPYLVGDYDTVAGELGRYIELGFRTFILDIPPSEEELAYTAQAFRLAEARLSS